MSTKSVTPSNFVFFHRLGLRRSEDDPDIVVAGRPDTGTFIELPAIGALAIDLLRQGRTVAQTELELNHIYDIEVDVIDLVEALIDLDFVIRVDDQVNAQVGQTENMHDSRDGDRGRYHFPRLARHHVSWIFSRPVAIIWAALVAAAIVELVRSSSMWPRDEQFYWTRYPGFAFTVNAVLWWLCTFGHEFMHLAAARSLDVPARIGLGTRLNYLVAQTDVTGIWLVPRRSRYRVYFAGAAWDIAVVASATLLLPVSPSIVSGPLAAMRLSLLVGLAYECAVYMRTDFYFALLDLLRCRNLWGDACTYLNWHRRRILHKVFPGAGGSYRAEELSPLTKLAGREARSVQIYTVLLTVGSVVTLLAWVTILIPIIITGITRSLHSLVGDEGWLRALDGGVFILIQIGFQALFVVTFLRSHRHWFHRNRQQAVT